METYSKRIFVFSIAILLAIFLSGCAQYIAYYDIGLIEVEGPVQTKVRYGDRKIHQSEIVNKSEGEVKKYHFEDEAVGTAWMPTESQISFAIRNKTNHPIKLIWDEALFVDVIGRSYRVVHSGVKYIEANKSQVPTVVAPQGFIEDIIFPSAYIYYAEGWKEISLFPNRNYDEKALKAEAESYIDKTVRVLLPIEIEGVINDYVFTFKIRGVSLKKLPKRRSTSEKEKLKLVSFQKPLKICNKETRVRSGF